MISKVVKIDAFRDLCNSRLQFHYPDGAGVAVIKFAQYVGAAGVPEPAFLHHAARCGIVHKVIGPDIVVPSPAETVVNHSVKSLGAIPLVPVWLTNPVAHLNVLPTNLYIALSMSVIPHTPYHMTGLLEFQRPGMTVRKDILDYHQTVLNRLMRWPAGTLAHIRVRCTQEQVLRIGLRPRPEPQSLCVKILHNLKSDAKGSFRFASLLQN